MASLTPTSHNMTTNNSQSTFDWIYGLECLIVFHFWCLFSEDAKKDSWGEEKGGWMNELYNKKKVRRTSWKPRGYLLRNIMIPFITEQKCEMCTEGNQSLSWTLVGLKVLQNTRVKCWIIRDLHELQTKFPSQCTQIIFLHHSAFQVRLYLFFLYCYLMTKAWRARVEKTYETEPFPFFFFHIS